MSGVGHLLPEHNAACERATLSSCNCFCHGAGHQHDLIKRAVTCTNGGANSLAQFRKDLVGVYGGFHLGFRDSATPARRKVPEGLPQIGLMRGRGATWIETILLDEAMHAAFIGVAERSVTYTAAEREKRKSLVVELAEGALRIVGGDVHSHNICDGHIWCSLLAEANEFPVSTPSGRGARYGRICYPRSAKPRLPFGLARVRDAGVKHIRETLRARPGVPDLVDIARLMGAASCPDLWHHPAAVRHSLGPFVLGASWPPNNTTSLVSVSDFDVLKDRWLRNGNW